MGGFLHVKSEGTWILTQICLELMAGVLSSMPSGLKLMCVLETLRTELELEPVGCGWGPGAESVVQDISLGPTPQSF